MRRLSLLVLLAACSSPATGGGGGGWYLPLDGVGLSGDAGAGGQDSGTSDLSSGTADGGGACVPGVTQLCLCAPKLEGVQVCRDDGKGWQACSCGGLDATGSDASSSDASAGPDGTGDLDVPVGSDSEAPDVAAQDAADLDAPDWSGYFDDTTADAGPVDAGLQPGKDCIARAKIIYLVTEQNILLSFDPEATKQQLKVVGALNCPAGSGATPFSMAVDRNATAWVLYKPMFGGSGSLFEVSTLDASCKATPFQPGQKGLDLFGMGFSSDGPGNINETLYVAGAGYSSFQYTNNTLASIAFPSLQLSTVGVVNVSGGADLTGNGLGQLFGFFPTTTPPSVREFNKATGATGKSWPLPSSAFSGIQAWAFAQWGGTFYLFFQSSSDSSTNIWTLDAQTGAVKKAMSSIGYTVTGAGVSSCAPVSQP